jgi:hypothetical protein
MGGSVEGEFDCGRAEAFGYHQTGRRYKPAREPDFAKHGDRPKPKKLAAKAATRHGLIHGKNVNSKTVGLSFSQAAAQKTWPSPGF